MFRLLTVAAFSVPAIFTGSIFYEAVVRGWSWTNENSRKMYVDAATTLITAAGIAVAIVVSVSAERDSRTADVIISTRHAAVWLIVCVVASMTTIIALTRCHERAKSRYAEQTKDFSQGRYSKTELLCFLIPGYFALTGFLLGFLYLGRIAFQL